MAPEYCLVYITTESRDEAQSIARALVTEKLAACVNFWPVESVFTWDGKLNETSEFALVAKTRSWRLRDLITRVKAMHSYEVPDIVAWPLSDGYQPYLAWVGEATR